MKIIIILICMSVMMYIIVSIARICYMRWKSIGKLKVTHYTSKHGSKLKITFCNGFMDIYEYDFLDKEWETTPRKTVDLQLLED